TNNWNATDMNKRLHVVWTNKDTNGFVFVGRMNVRGGMQAMNNHYEKEIELLMNLLSNENNEVQEDIKEQNKLEQVKDKEIQDVKTNEIEIKKVLYTFGVIVSEDKDNINTTNRKHIKPKPKS
ncbi:hypothetical protein RFI_29266, partial [Reticulomyxa filosa]